MNRSFLDELRQNSCYPTFRAFVGLGTILGYLAAGGFALAGGLSGQIGSFALGMGIAFAVGFLVNVLREASLMLADIGDAALFLASSQRNVQLPDDKQRSNYVSPEDLAALARPGSRV